MFHVFGAELCRAPCRGRGAPWLAGRGRRMTACQVTSPAHTRLLPIRYHWRNDLLDTELPDQQPPFNETQGCSWLVQKTGRRGTLQPGKGFPVCFPALVGPGALGSGYHPLSAEGHCSQVPLGTDGSFQCFLVLLSSSSAGSLLMALIP